MAYQTINPANTEAGQSFPEHTPAELEARPDSGYNECEAVMSRTVTNTTRYFAALSAKAADGLAFPPILKGAVFP